MSELVWQISLLPNEGFLEFQKSKKKKKKKTLSNIEADWNESTHTSQ